MSEHGPLTSISDLFEEPDGATPLDHGDRAGLIPTWVATRSDLNAAEHANIARALLWTESNAGPRSLDALLTEKSMRALHRQMFGDVWRWAGDYRRHNTNIGTDWPYIAAQLRDLLADVRLQTDGPVASLPWPPDELAVRFHHRLVVIHPFPNGNGRHARLAADLLVSLLGRPVFSWGAQDISLPGGIRESYLSALRHADRTYEYGPLISFARR